MSNEKRKRRKPRAIISESAVEVFDKVRARLAEREMQGFESAELVDAMIDCVGAQFFDDFIEEKTPLEYKIKLALRDDSKRAEIERLFAKTQKLKRNTPERTVGAS